jgi:C-terminal processing protease CtpA/Prc
VTLRALSTGPVLLITVGLLLAMPVVALATNAGEDRARREAAEFERKGDWRAAAEAYWKLLGGNRSSAELRDKYLYCLRHVRLNDRHADPVFNKHVQDLPLAKALTAYLDALGKVQANYVDRDRIGLSSLFRHGLDELGYALGDPVFRQAHLPDADDDAIRTFAAKVRDDWAEAAVTKPDDVRQAVKRIALDAQKALGVKPAFVVMEFVCGACNALDERTAFLPPSEEYTTHVGQLTALGLLVIPTPDGHAVEKVASGSWAAEAGLKDGDRITRMAHRDEKDEIGPLTEIDVQSRGDMAPRTVKLPESLPSVVVEDEMALMMTGIAYVRITSFQRNTLSELEVALARLRGMRALILDLRGNPGGLFPVAVQIAERFLPAGVIVTTQGQAPAFNRTFESRSGMAAIDVPLVVLIDGETASAAEVLAGALKDNGRAWLIGTPTFGKGTIQTVLQLTDGGGIRITLARFFTPQGQPYNGVGVAPNQLQPFRARDAAFDYARNLLAMRPD